MEIVSVSSKGQIVIPERIRKNFKIKKGTRLVLLETSKGLLLTDEAKIEDSILENMHYDKLVEKGLADVWENEDDAKIWKEYL